MSLSLYIGVFNKLFYCTLISLVNVVNYQIKIKK